MISDALLLKSFNLALDFLAGDWEWELTRSQFPYEAAMDYDQAIHRAWTGALHVILNADKYRFLKR